MNYEEASIEAYNENARRIARGLENAFPRLGPSGKDCDFRPGHGGEKICSGVMYRAGLIPFHDPDAEPVDPSGPIAFKILYAGWEKCLEGIATLMALKMSFEVKCAAEGYTRLYTTWIIMFKLPQNYRVPSELSAG